LDNFKNNNTKRDQTPINHQIRGFKVFCIDHNGTNLGLIETSKALEIAQENDLDLVQISYNTKENVPTCKILDYGKFKFQAGKNAKAAAKKQREAEIKTKEIKLRPQTEENDLKVKAKKAQEILDDGDKVRISIVFRGRELNYKELAFEQYDNFIGLLSNFQTVEFPTLNGKILSGIITRLNDQRINHIKEQTKRLPPNHPQAKQDESDIKYVTDEVVEVEKFLIHEKLKILK
jgi:translation initiation factor IF-3